MKIYHHLPGYLHRWKVLGWGRFMVRVHHLLDIDRTPFLHTHPFSYLSIVWRGGYTERVRRKDGSLHTLVRRTGSIAWRSSTTAHRIDHVEPGCATLFLTWKRAGAGQGWTLERHPDVSAPPGYHDVPDGLHAFERGHRKRKGGMWYALRPSRADAEACEVLSIHQNLDPRAGSTQGFAG